jgi:carboxymethylenebutenolidase
MAGQMVRFPSNGGTAEGYLAVPAGGSGPGVLVIQEYWGIVPHIQDVCEQFAREGFVALAPDLFHGTKTEEPDEADKLMMALNIDQAAKDLRGAAAYLKSRPETTSQQLGVVGYCMGGQLALYAASVSPEIGPVVDNYGVHPNVQPDYQRMSGPVLGNFAAEDAWVAPGAVPKLEGELRAAGIQTDFKTYPGTHHAFIRDHFAGVTDPNAAPTPQRQAARDAWQRAIAFFRQHLK